MTYFECERLFVNRFLVSAPLQKQNPAGQEISNGDLQLPISENKIATLSAVLGAYRRSNCLQFIAFTSRPWDFVQYAVRMAAPQSLNQYLNISIWSKFFEFNFPSTFKLSCTFERTESLHARLIRRQHLDLPRRITAGTFPGRTFIFLKIHNLLLPHYVCMENLFHEKASYPVPVQKGWFPVGFRWAQEGVKNNKHISSSSCCHLSGGRKSCCLLLELRLRLDLCSKR